MSKQGEEEVTGMDLITEKEGGQMVKKGILQCMISDHDDESLSLLAAMAYDLGNIKEVWPWENQFKPTGDCIKDLTKAGALYLAEVDRYMSMNADDGSQ
jgi:hypothetical protein